MGSTSEAEHGSTGSFSEEVRHRKLSSLQRDAKDTTTSRDSRTTPTGRVGSIKSPGSYQKSAGLPQKTKSGTTYVKKTVASTTGTALSLVEQQQFMGTPMLPQSRSGFSGSSLETTEPLQSIEQDVASQGDTPPPASFLRKKTHRSFSSTSSLPLTQQNATPAADYVYTLSSKRSLTPGSKASSSARLKRRRTDKSSDPPTQNLYGTRSRCRAEKVDFFSDLNNPFPPPHNPSSTPDVPDHKEFPVFSGNIADIEDCKAIRYPILLPAGKYTYDMIENAEDLEELKNPATDDGDVPNQQKGENDETGMQEANRTASESYERRNDSRILVEEIRKAFENAQSEVVQLIDHVVTQASSNRGGFADIDSIREGFVKNFQMTRQELENSLIQRDILPVEEDGDGDGDDVASLAESISVLGVDRKELLRDSTSSSFLADKKFRETVTPKGATVIDYEDSSDGENVGNFPENQGQSKVSPTPTLDRTSKHAPHRKLTETVPEMNIDPTTIRPNGEHGNSQVSFVKEILGPYLGTPVLSGRRKIYDLSENDLRSIRKILETDLDTRVDEQKFRRALKAAHREGEKQGQMQSNNAKNPAANPATSKIALQAYHGVGNASETSGPLRKACASPITDRATPEQKISVSRRVSMPFRLAPSAESPRTRLSHF